MYFFLIMFAFLIRNNNSIAINTRFCVNCKYIIPNNDLGIEYSTCSLFENIDNQKYLISGNSDDIERGFYSCSSARSFESMCGKDGKKYEKKDNKKLLKKIVIKK